MPVQEKDFNGIKGKWGYMDRFGKLRISVKWDSASLFCEGLAAVQSDGKWGYINTSGDIMIPLQFAHADDFHEGIAVVRGAETDKEGYIDTLGNVVVPFEYDMAYTFANGFGKVRMFGRQGSGGQPDEPDTYAMFDRNGVKNANWSNIEEFSEGFAWAVGFGGRGLLLTAGKVLSTMSGLRKSPWNMKGFIT